MYKLKSVLKTNVEKIELVKKSKTGDLEALKKLLASDIAYIRNKAKSIANSYLKVDRGFIHDLEQSGIEGYLYGVKKLDLSKLIGENVLTYLNYWIMSEMRKTIRKEHGYVDACGVQFDVNTKEALFIDGLPFEKKITRLCVLVDQLSQLHKYVIVNFYGINTSVKTITYIAKNIVIKDRLLSGCSITHIKILKQQAKNKLKEWLLSLD